MSDRLSVLPCEGRRDWRLFENVPELLHHRLDNFRPPFPGRVAGLRKRSHPFHAHGRIYPLIARRGKEPLGRIAAIVNETHNRFHADRTGFFGFFDFVDDEDIARRLLDAAVARLAGEGMTLLRGPFSPTQNDECGVLVAGFDRPPPMLMPYNPAYYLGVYESLGLVGARDYYSYSFTNFADVDSRVGRVVARARNRNNLTFRVADLRDRRELPTVEALFNETLRNEWNFMPTTLRDLESGGRELWPVREKAPLIIVEHRGEPVGFSLMLPDLNEFMQMSRGWKGLARLLRLAFNVSIRKPGRFRLAALGVRDDFRSRGVAQLLCLESARLAQDGVAEATWIQDINPDLNTAVSAMGLELAQTYRIFQRTIGPEA